jgi:hypothetical protein
VKAPRCAGQARGLVIVDSTAIVAVPAEVVPQAIREATEKVPLETHIPESPPQWSYQRGAYAKQGVL